MKKVNGFSISVVAAFVLSAIFLYSCTSTSVVSTGMIQKRKYRNGFYTPLASRNFHKPDRLKNNKAKKIAEMPTIATTQSINIPVQSSNRTLIKKRLIAPTLTENKISTQLTKKIHKAEINQIVNNQGAISKSAKETTSEGFYKQIQSTNLAENTSTATSSSSGGNLVLMIILCLFPIINLIPVYLHDGKSVTTNFWITLLLDIVFGLGVIFALLVVLDVIDLS